MSGTACPDSWPRRTTSSSTSRCAAAAGRASTRGAISWLLSAGLVDKCVRVSSGRVPLRLQEDAGAFKVYANDVGLLSTMSGIPAAVLFDDRKRSLLDAGGLTENYVVQQMVARGITPRYWTSGNRAEVDLVVEDGSAGAVPVEVKSTENARSRSLGVYREKYRPNRVVRVSARDFGTGDVESIPLYAVAAWPTGWRWRRAPRPRSHPAPMVWRTLCARSVEVRSW
ncbi:DUF4143 domain-containing protein [Olsenella uli]|uniref:DUF4143 domain-containing protein n=1 Tax=Olsenella uli TaxID=133926 RepID=UPI00138ABE1E|nr:DUF4143 domain-containing protein [Olsenella uli]